MAVETFTIEEQIKYYREESWKEGFKQGFKQGWEEGFKQGLEEAILKMLKGNMPVNKICEIMDLTYEQVTEIKNKMAD